MYVLSELVVSSVFVIVVKKICANRVFTSLFQRVFIPELFVHYATHSSLQPSVPIVVKMLGFDLAGDFERCSCCSFAHSVEDNISLHAVYEKMEHELRHLRMHENMVTNHVYVM